MDIETGRQRRDVVRGSLLGVAVGDGLGAPFEGAPPVLRRQVEEWAAAPGPLRYTDDTAMTLVLAGHLGSRRGTVEEDRLARDFAEEWRSDPDRGYGASPPRIFSAVLAGEDWAEVAAGVFGSGGSWGNGGAMRVAPVAHLPKPLADRAELARRQAAVTHAHALAQDGAALQCAVVAAVAASPGAVLDVEQVVAEVAAHASTDEFRRALDVVREAVTAGWPAERIATRLGTDVSALGSVPTAVALALRAPDDLETALVSAVEVGGDTDTIAAMVGAIVGARVGERGVPAHLVARLEDADRITAAADALATLRS
ncbi:MAG TPA: ADP-ribosylglycohydrolase family protein [Marmoricola sp.]|nr:ADP-ribosylglycohydrolase family protein [Marmoricola sp.]